MIFRIMLELVLFVVIWIIYMILSLIRKPINWVMKRLWWAMIALNPNKEQIPSKFRES